MIKKSLPDVIISIVVLIWLATLAIQLPEIPEVSRSYPVILVVAAAAMTVILLVKNLLKLRDDEKVETKALAQARIMIPYCLLIGAYIWLLNKIGYMIATVGFMIASLFFLKLKNKVLIIVVSAAVTLILYYVFTDFLVVVLPKGSWINMAF